MPTIKEIADARAAELEAAVTTKQANNAKEKKASEFLAEQGFEQKPGSLFFLLRTDIEFFFISAYINSEGLKLATGPKNGMATVYRFEIDDFDGFRAAAIEAIKNASSEPRMI